MSAFLLFSLLCVSSGFSVLACLTMEKSTLATLQFGAVRIVSPPPLQFPTSSAVHLLSKHHDDAIDLPSPALSSSQGESRPYSGADSGPVGPQRSLPDTSAADDAEIIASHDDSFYASLMEAQQLRRQSEATKHAAVGGQRSPLSASRSHASAASLACSPCDEPPVHAPRTLQDLLSWRQEMIDARRKEHQESEVEHDRAGRSHAFSSLDNASTSPEESVTRLLLPQTPSPPVLTQGAQHNRIVHLPSVESTVTPTKQASTYHHNHYERPAPLREIQACVVTAPHVSSQLTHRTPRVLHEPWMVSSRPHSSATSTTASSALSSRTTSRWLEKSRDFTGMEEISAYLRLHDNDIGQSLTTRFFLFFLMILILLYFLGELFFPFGGF